MEPKSEGTVVSRRTRREELEHRSNNSGTGVTYAAVGEEGTVFFRATPEYKADSYHSVGGVR